MPPLPSLSGGRTWNNKVNGRLSNRHRDIKSIQRKNLCLFFISFFSWAWGNHHLPDACLSSTAGRREGGLRNRALPCLHWVSLVRCWLAAGRISKMQSHFCPGALTFHFPVLCVTETARAWRGRAADVRVEDHAPSAVAWRIPMRLPVA